MDTQINTVGQKVHSESKGGNMQTNAKKKDHNGHLHANIRFEDLNCPAAMIIDRVVCAC